MDFNGITSNNTNNNDSIYISNEASYDISIAPWLTSVIDRHAELPNTAKPNEKTKIWLHTLITYHPQAFSELSQMIYNQASANTQTNNIVFEWLDSLENNQPNVYALIDNQPSLGATRWLNKVINNYPRIIHELKSEISSRRYANTNQQIYLNEHDNPTSLREQEQNNSIYINETRGISNNNTPFLSSIDDQPMIPSPINSQPVGYSTINNEPPHYMSTRINGQPPLSDVNINQSFNSTMSDNDVVTTETNNDCLSLFSTNNEYSSDSSSINNQSLMSDSDTATNHSFEQNNLSSIGSDSMETEDIQRSIFPWLNTIINDYPNVFSNSNNLPTEDTQRWLNSMFNNYPEIFADLYDYRDETQIVGQPYENINLVIKKHPEIFADNNNLPSSDAMAWVSSILTPHKEMIANIYNRALTNANINRRQSVSSVSSGYTSMSYENNDQSSNSRPIIDSSSVSSNHTIDASNLHEQSRDSDNTHVSRR